MTKELLKTKAIIKKKRPSFRRSGAVHTLRISRTGYRRSKGLHNKNKDQRKGHQGPIKTGYAYPVVLRNINAQGRKIVYVSTMQQLALHKPSEVAVIVDSNLGAKRKVELLTEMIAKKYISQNVYDLNKFLTGLKTGKETAKTQKAKQKQLRMQSKENSLKLKQGKKAEKTPTQAQVDAAEAEKQENDKVLIGKN